MLKATLRQGVIVPLDPLPTEWVEGTQLEIDIAVDGRTAPSFDIDEWAQAMDSLCADSADGDERIMRRAIEEQRDQAKALMRRKMGLTA